MPINFKWKDVLHRIPVKFVPAFLPKARKNYFARSVLQTPLDIHDIASKAQSYNILTSPSVIEQGLTDGLLLIGYLVADGYKIRTDVMRLSIRLPGEYDGTETHLPPGVYPEVRIRVAPALRDYIRDSVQVVFDGVDESKGIIGRVKDEVTGKTDEIITIDNLITVHGYGLKISSDKAHAAQAGAFLVDENRVETRVKAIAGNEPRKLKLLTPVNLTPGAAYTLLIRTQSPVKSSTGFLKDLREVCSEFALTAQ
ncbi:MAG: DUF4469 domain-containing protein [Tannerella sp.]|jgi:hypothetical protein|nr:DUF4469 domain-containing protein [Tannerella sp.]